MGDLGFEAAQAGENDVVVVGLRPGVAGDPSAGRVGGFGGVGLSTVVVDGADDDGTGPRCDVGETRALEFAGCRCEWRGSSFLRHGRRRSSEGKNSSSRYSPTPEIPTRSKPVARPAVQDGFGEGGHEDIVVERRRPHRHKSGRYEPPKERGNSGAHIWCPSADYSSRITEGKNGCPGTLKFGVEKT